MDFHHRLKMVERQPHSLQQNQPYYLTYPQNSQHHQYIDHPHSLAYHQHQSTYRSYQSTLTSHQRSDTSLKTYFLVDYFHNYYPDHIAY